MSVIHTPRKPTLNARMILFPIICGAFLLVLFFRLWYFQVVLSPELTEVATTSGPPIVSALAPRGLIYDRENHLLAGVQPEIVITAVPVIVKKNPWVLAKVAAMCNVPEETLRKKLAKAVKPKVATPIFSNASIEVGTRIAEAGDELPGIQIDTEPMRYYPDTTDFTHVLGNVWVPSKSDVDRLEKLDVTPAEFVGKFGIEWFYEKQLMGRPGSMAVQLDAQRHVLPSVEKDSPIPGDQMVLGLDSRLQKIANDELNGRKGAVVALDPRTGEILCMVSKPSFDLALYQGGISQDNYDKLNSDADKPFLNRAINGFYAPGSTFKIVTSLAMLRTNNLDPNATVFCDGAFREFKGHPVKCLGFHGAINYKHAMEKSCNTYFCTMGMRVGAEALQKAAFDFGLGSPTDVDLSSARQAGVVPTPEYKEKHKMGPWVGGDTANTSIGQGYVLTSPLQMADVVAMVANRGTLYKPHFLKGFRPAGSKEIQLIKPEVFHQIDAPSSFWDTLTEALVGVVDEGTAMTCRIPGVSWAGKTGSAEFKHGGKTHSWFVGFAPAVNPKIAIAVVVEEGGHGAEAAAPVAHDIVKAYLLPPKAPDSEARLAASTAAASSTRFNPSASPTLR